MKARRNPIAARERIRDARDREAVEVTRFMSSSFGLRRTREVAGDLHS
jgi:hypothetical protein